MRNALLDWLLCKLGAPRVIWVDPGHDHDFEGYNPTLIGVCSSCFTRKAEH